MLACSDAVILRVAPQGQRVTARLPVSESFSKNIALIAGACSNVSPQSQGQLPASFRWARPLTPKIKQSSCKQSEPSRQQTSPTSQVSAGACPCIRVNRPPPPPPPPPPWEMQLPAGLFQMHGLAGGQGREEQAFRILIAIITIMHLTNEASPHSADIISMWANSPW